MVELLKRVGIPKKLSPIVSIILGILCGFYYLAPGDPKKAVFLGVVVGLSAVGLWSGTKNTFEEFTSNLNDTYRFTSVRGKNKKVKNRAGSLSLRKEDKRTAKK